MQKNEIKISVFVTAWIGTSGARADLQSVRFVCFRPAGFAIRQCGILAFAMRKMIGGLQILIIATAGLQIPQDVANDVCGDF
jgi:hypothetical protein